MTEQKKKILFVKNFVCMCVIVVVVVYVKLIGITLISVPSTPYSTI